MGPVQLLHEALKDGHTFPESGYLRALYIRKGCRFVARDLRGCYEDGTLVKVQDQPALPHTVKAEASIARWLALRSGTSEGGGWDTPYPPEAALNGAQRLAWEGLASKHTAIVTGGPGTGKTHMLSYLIKSWVKNGKKVQAAAPTGMAASVMALRLGMKVETVHALLGMVPGQVAPSRAVDADVLVVDESTMLDSEMMNALMSSVEEQTKLILVGDPDQLPPVSYGQPFHDLVRIGQNTDLLAVFQLTANMRTDKRGLLELLDAVRHGELCPLGDGVSHFRAPPSAGVDLIVQFDRMERRFPGIKRKDVLLLAGLRQERFGMGTEAINHYISHQLLKTRIHGEKFAVGDRVMFTINDRYHGFVNGERGELLAWEKGRNVHVLSDTGKEYVLLASDCHQKMEWAYAVTVHKAQGSQSRVVLFPIDPQHMKWADRRSIYTALSRGQEHVSLIGELDLLAAPLKKEMERSTLLGRVDIATLKGMVQTDPVKDFWERHQGEYA